MPFRSERNCKICQSKIRSKIDKMMIKNATGPAIIKFAEKNDLFISMAGITRHKKNHCDFTHEDVKIAKDKLKAERQYEANLAKYVSSTEFLEKITSDVFERIKKGSLVPTIDHGLKAIELQAKLKEGNLIEKTLIDFMMQFTPESLGPREAVAVITDPPTPALLEAPPVETSSQATEAVQSLIVASQAGELCGSTEPRYQEENS